jgi:hypothetical protein
MFQRLKSLFAAKSPIEFRDPEFGVLTLDSGLWIGQMHRGDRTLRFCIGGTETQPNAGLLAGMRELVERFPEVERTALDFLCTQEDGVRHDEFEFYSLDFLWEDQPHCFALEFTLTGDDDGIWRVEHEDGRPKFVGRDD